MWIIQIARGIERFGVSPVIEPYSFGASDANLFQAHGINVAVLGNGVENTHTTTERVELTQLTTTYSFLLSFLTMT
jgi:di/tripeptidase